jgi:hypothetical protein
MKETGGMRIQTGDRKHEDPEWRKRNEDPDWRQEE